MKLKVKSLLFLLLLSVGISVSAQDLSKKAMMKIETEVTEIATVIGLDDTQKGKVLELNKEMALAKMKLGKAPDGGSAEYKAARKKIQEKYNAGMAEVCSKEQLKKWKNYAAEKKKK